MTSLASISDLKTSPLYHTGPLNCSVVRSTFQSHLCTWSSLCTAGFLAFVVRTGCVYALDSRLNWIPGILGCSLEFVPYIHHRPGPASSQKLLPNFEVISATKQKINGDSKWLQLVLVIIFCTPTQSAEPSQTKPKAMGGWKDGKMFFVQSGLKYKIRRAMIFKNLWLLTGCFNSEQIKSSHSHTSQSRKVKSKTPSSVVSQLSVVCGLLEVLASYWLQWGWSYFLWF